jgi:hypothetical protein
VRDDRASSASTEVWESTLLPEQIHTQPVVSEGVKALCGALVDDAIDLVLRKDLPQEKLYHWKENTLDVSAASMWLRSPAEHIFSFRFCCRVNGVDPDAAQEAISRGFTRKRRVRSRGPEWR